MLHCDCCNVTPLVMLFDEIKARLAIHALIISLGVASCHDRQHVLSFDGRPIETVGFRFAGEKGVNEKQLSRVIRSAPGSRYSADVINNDIRALFESGLVASSPHQPELRS